jgi:hypothetical protein
MALKGSLILSRPPPGPRFARPEDKLRGLSKDAVHRSSHFYIPGHGLSDA